MLRRRVCLTTAAIFLGFSTTANAAGPPLEPKGNWVVDYGEAQCVASREYGTPEKPLALGIRPAPNGQTYELLLARKASGPAFAIEVKGSVDFGRGPIDTWVLNHAPKKSGLNIYQFRISSADMQQALSAPSVALDVEGGRDTRLALSAMAALLKGLSDCTADLQRYWNMGGEKDGRIAKVSKGDVRSLFSARDYPDEAMKRRQSGTSQFLLLVDEKGAVAGCHLVEASGIPALDAMGCQVIRERAKFQPAVDAKGKPVRSTLVTPKVVWRIER